MNHERIAQVRDKIASLPVHKFTMRDFCTVDGSIAFDLEHDCDTAGCIAGWTCFLFAPTQLPSGWLAARLLGLTVDQASDLFYPSNLSARSQEEAVEVLTNLHNRGDITWQ